MRRLNGGDIEARLARIEIEKTRGKGWRKRAKAKLLADQGAIRHDKSRGRLAGYEFERGHICAKVRYTKREAYYQLQEAKASMDPMRKEQRAYRCHFCKGYHLTSKEFNHGHETQQVKSESEAGRNQGNLATNGRGAPSGRTGARRGSERERIAQPQG